MHRFLLLIPFISLTTAPAVADSSHFSCQLSTSKSIAGLVDDNACVGFEIKAVDGTVTKTIKFPFHGSGNLLST